MTRLDNPKKNPLARRKNRPRLIGGAYIPADQGHNLRITWHALGAFVETDDFLFVSIAHSVIVPLYRYYSSQSKCTRGKYAYLMNLKNGPMATDNLIKSKSEKTKW
jgi:hypothetical protein